MLKKKIIFLSKLNSLQKLSYTRAPSQTIVHGGAEQNLFNLTNVA